MGPFQNHVDSIKAIEGMTPDLCFFVFTQVTHLPPKFWHSYVITYGDFMVIVKQCIVNAIKIRHEILPECSVN